MNFNPNELGAFLGVEGRHIPEDPAETIEFRLSRPTDQLILQIHQRDSVVDIQIVGSDTAVLFGSMFPCDGISVHDESPSKLAPHVEMRVAGSSLGVCSFHLGGPPHYSFDFLAYFGMNSPSKPDAA